MNRTSKPGLPHNSLRIVRLAQLVRVPIHISLLIDVPLTLLVLVIRELSFLQGGWAICL